MQSLNFDYALPEIFNEYLKIYPFDYLSIHFKLIENQLQSIKSLNEIPDEKHSNQLQIIKNHKEKCFTDCRNNLYTFQQRLNQINVKKIELSKNKLGNQNFAEQCLNIRNELIQLRKEIFKKNIFFLESFGSNKNGYLVIIEPLLLDDQQIEIIKFYFYY